MRIVAAACTFAILLTSCSDGRLDKSELISQADEICARANRETTALGEPTSEKDFAALIDEASKIQDEALADLRELEPPEEDEEEYRSMIDALQRANAYLPDFQQAVEAKDETAMQEVGVKIQSAAAEAEEIAREYGFETCASSRLAGEQ